MAESKSTRCVIAAVAEDTDGGDEPDAGLSRAKGMYCKKHAFVYAKAHRSQKTHASLGNPTAVDEEGLLIDVEVQPVNDGVMTHKDTRRDIDTFFSPPFLKAVNGHAKKYCSCKLCLYVPLLDSFILCSLTKASA